MANKEPPPPLSTPGGTRRITDRADSLGTQTISTAALNAAGAKLRMAPSHFIQEFQPEVARGRFTPSGRARSELSVNEETVPNP